MAHATFISVDEARTRILAQIRPLPATVVGLAEALGMVAAEDVCAPVNVPAFDNSAYDGYAVRSADLAGAGPRTPRRLPVADTIPAGAVSVPALAAGMAARIMTGAPLPAGADAVVPFEETDRTDWGGWGDARVPPAGDPPATARHGPLDIAKPMVRPARDADSQGDRLMVGIKTAPVPGANVRRAGADVRAGAVVLRAGQVVRPVDIGLLASAGIAQVAVVRRAVVAILPTGDELVEIDHPIRPGQVRNSNAWMLEAAARQYGAIPRRLAASGDTADELRAAVIQAGTADLIVTIGGVSVGDYDVVKQVLGDDGELDFWQINMKPGKPLAFGKLAGAPCIGLPGNPVSSLVGFELFVRPALLQMMGHTNLAKAAVQATSAERLASSEGKRTFVRVRLQRRDGRLVCAPTGDQGSFRLSSVTEAHGLAEVREGATIEPGHPVTVLVLDERAALVL
ncbi:MAG: molybdopterin molybdotransferase MoeA [Actinobacteria bacterium]|nr:molybdopterin molybdotransferase MoeA [Actinomycetota bacterium]